MLDDRRRYLAAVLALAALGVVLRLSVLWAGYAVDDFAQLAMLDGAYPVRRAPWDLYRFSSGAPEEVARLRAAGALSWWSDDHLRFAALRPLASLLRAAEVAAFGADETVAAHAQGLVWWAATVVAFGLALRRLVPASVALWAVFFYVCEEGHAVALTWVANRAALVAAFFVVLAASEALRPDGRPWRIVLWTSLALAAGEYGLAAVALAGPLLVVWSAASRRSTVARGLALAGPTAAYLVAHRLLGYGARGSAIYVDPGADPIAFAKAAAMRLPILLADGLWGWTADAAALAPDRAGGRVLAGLLGAALFVAAIVRSARPGRPRAVVWAAAGGTVAALVPLCGAFVSTRLWVVPGLALAVGWGFVVVAAFRRGRDVRRGRAFFLAAAAAVVLWHGPGAAVRSVRTAVGYARANAAAVAALRASDVGDLAGRDVVVYAAIDPTTLLYGWYLAGAGGRPRSWLVLSGAPAPLTIRRPRDRTVAVDVHGPLFATPLERLFRAAPWDAGRRADLAAGAVSVTRGPAGGPVTIRLDLARGAKPVFVVATPTGLRCLPPPPVGGRLRLPAPAVPLRPPASTW